jgi:hypothetical protein
LPLGGTFRLAEEKSWQGGPAMIGIDILAASSGGMVGFCLIH